jgi:hypothetical protein
MQVALGATSAGVWAPRLLEKIRETTDSALKTFERERAEGDPPLSKQSLRGLTPSHLFVDPTTPASVAQALLPVLRRR